MGRAGLWGVLPTWVWVGGTSPWLLGTQPPFATQALILIKCKLTYKNDQMRITKTNYNKTLPTVLYTFPLIPNRKLVEMVKTQLGEEKKERKALIFFFWSLYLVEFGANEFIFLLSTSRANRLRQSYCKLIL